MTYLANLLVEISSAKRVANAPPRLCPVTYTFHGCVLHCASLEKGLHQFNHINKLILNG